VEPQSASLGALYATHAPAAVRLALGITGDRMLAEDLVQEAFARLAARFPELRDPDAFGAYLRTTVTNLARSHFRRLSVERSFLEREVAMQTTGRGPESHLEVWDALLRLPPRQRAAIALRYYEDLSVDQVAAVLGCPAGTVKSLASRGIAQLRKELVAEPARELVA
jgi:RNA polymerase sigma-70 factor (sigma-E family)